MAMLTPLFGLPVLSRRLFVTPAMGICLSPCLAYRGPGYRFEARFLHPSALPAAVTGMKRSRQSEKTPFASHRLDRAFRPTCAQSGLEPTLQQDVRRPSHVEQIASHGLTGHPTADQTGSVDGRPMMCLPAMPATTPRPTRSDIHTLQRSPVPDTLTFHVALLRSPTR